MLKATLAAAVFSFILQLPPPSPPPATPSPLLPIFAFFCFLLTSQLSHIKNANNLLALYANRAQARESARAWSGHATGRGLAYNPTPLHSPFSPSTPHNQANLEAKAQRVKSKRFNIYGTLYGLWAYFKTSPQTTTESPSPSPISQQQMMIFRDRHIVYIYIAI